MNINLGQTVYVNDDLANVAQVYPNEIIVQFGNGMFQSFNPNEIVPMSGRQAHAYITLAEIVYLLQPRAVSEVIAGIRVGIQVGEERHDYVIDEIGRVSVVGTPSAAQARKHQEIIEILGVLA